MGKANLIENNFSLDRFSKYQIFIGFILGLWIFGFLVLIGPFDTASLSISNRLVMMPLYGLIFTFCYICSIPVQHFVSRIWPNSVVKVEAVVISYIFISTLFLTYAYYKSSFIVGECSFLPYLTQIYLPTIFLILSLLTIVRWYLRKSESIHDKKIILGKGKYSKIKLALSDFIFAKASDNYVEIHYLENNQLKVKLIRCSLKELKVLVPELVQTHRSYLMNKNHLKSWNSRNQISVTLSEIPVSDAYRDTISKLMA